MNKTPSAWPSCIELIFSYRTFLMGVAILVIMLYHWALVAPSNLILLPFAKSGHLGVDLFYFLSGMGVAVSLGKNSYGRFWRNRLLRLLLPWLLLSFIVYLSIDSASWGNGDLLTCLFRYWFLNVLVIFYAVSPLFMRFVQRFGLIGIVVVALLLELLSYAYLQPELRCHFSYIVDFNIVRGVPRIPSFLLGLYMVTGRDELQNWLLRKPVLLLALSLLLLSAFITNGLFAGGGCMFRWIIAAFSMPMACYGLARILHMFPHKNIMQKVMFLFGAVSLELYLWHTPLYVYMAHMHIPEKLGAWMACLVFFVLSLIGAWVVHGICFFLALSEKRIRV